MPKSNKTKFISYKDRIKKYLTRISFWLGLVGVLALVYDYGYIHSESIENTLATIYILTLLGGIVFIITCYAISKYRPRKQAWPFDALLLFFTVAMIAQKFGLIEIELLKDYKLYKIAILLVFIRQLAVVQINFRRKYLNPAQLFITSFIMIILAGTALLMLPNASHTPISFLNALFTSTSAVCVTGLVVVDTGTYFTQFGQIIILILIQAGGIGIMTFTSYFGYFFRGGASYQNRLMMQDMNNSEKTAEVFSTLKKIILITFIIEAVGALLVYTSLDNSVIPLAADRIFFAVFHSISGFCNAGFSTLSDSLYDIGFRYNYYLQITLAFLFIIGGLGFPIVFNTITYLRHLFINRLFKKKALHAPWIIGINTRIVVITTLSLLVIGTVLFYIFEYHNTLEEHSGWGKVAIAFFSAATPRTAGFNSVDTTMLNFPTIMVIFIMMWVGASPGSTGGGIKTSTLAIAVLNVLSIAKGKDRIEVFKREISPISTRRAFAIITLSLVVLGISIFFLAHFDSEKGLLPLAFESFSAFSTVGLSLGITSELSDPGKIVIILTMFVGRVSMLTILVAFLRRIVNLKYKFPTEDVLIN